MEPKSPGEVGCKVGGAPKNSLSLIWSLAVTCSLHGRQQLLCKVYHKLEQEIAHLQSKICVLVLQPKGFTLKVNNFCLQFAFYVFMG